MSNPLEGCLAKIERAKELIHDVDQVIAELLRDGGYRVTSQNQPEKNRYAFWVEGPTIPHRVSVIAGEVFHHLRSALDHVVWALAQKTRSAPSNRIQFPVADTPKKLKDAIRRGDLDGVPQAARTLIESIQPYQADPPERSLLKALHQLDIVDKHRLLNVVTTAMRPDTRLVLNPKGPGLMIILPEAKSGATPFHRATEDGIEVQWIAYDPGAPDVEIENDFSIEIVFEEVAARERQPVVQTLVNFCGGIEAYVKLFAPLFETA